MDRTCFNCKQTKPVSEFYRSSVIYYQKECKICNRERKYRWHHTEAGKLSSANTKLKRRFGITLEQYEDMLKEQGGRCMICGAIKSTLNHKLAVDHDHKTSKIRGLLCKSCNLGIGNFLDSPVLLQNAISYLTRETEGL